MNLTNVIGTTATADTSVNFPQKQADWTGVGLGVTGILYAALGSEYVNADDGVYELQNPVAASYATLPVWDQGGFTLAGANGGNISLTVIPGGSGVARATTTERGGRRHFRCGR